MAKKCFSCAYLNHEEAKFCENCGAKLPLKESVSLQPQTRAGVNRWKVISAISIAILIILDFDITIYSPLYNENVFNKTRADTAELEVANLTKQVTSLQIEKILLQSHVSSLDSQVSSLKIDLKNLQTQVTSLQSDNARLQRDNARLQTQLSQLQTKYLYSSIIPYTLIQNGTVEWFFKDLEGNTFNWIIPIDTYTAYVNMPRSSDFVSLTFKDGTIIKAFEGAEQRTHALSQIRTTPTTFTFSIPIG